MAPCLPISKISVHFRHFIRTVRAAILSSAIWYLALQLGQMNFIQIAAHSKGFLLRSVSLSVTVSKSK